VPRFLTQTWVDQVNEAMGDVSVPSDVDLAVAHHVAGGPDGDVVYVLRMSGGAVDARLADASDTDVHLYQDYATAAAIARGELSAQQAVAAGRLRVAGDTRALVRHADAFSAVANAFRHVAADTTY
jgi:putative sterol carrier protein